ncbi:DNA-3-methyladenine glycosylase [Kineococcus endophyticus]|uniref:Putative 3-methyladenine DNA glycosylase n=1 Tax=Kineococcus endophyticus TaxID=1181883 RepID=A0ABV3P1S9_9ACTN
MGTALSLDRSFFDRDVLVVARDLLGRVVRHTTGDGAVAVRLTEVEAYAGESDPGSHAFRGPTPRTRVMFGPPGHAYVYFSYGMHWCMNLVCGPEGTASAVLLRAGEVVDGLDLARSRRVAARREVDLARGPARLTQALGVDRALDGVDVCADGALAVFPGEPVGDADVVWGPRVGVAGAGAPTPWRVSLVNEPTVSAYRVGGRRSPTPKT